MTQQDERDPMDDSAPEESAALVAAAVLGLAALVAVVFLAPGRGSVATSAGAPRQAPPTAPPPSFMDRSGRWMPPGPGSPMARGDTAPAIVPPPLLSDSGRRRSRYGGQSGPGGSPPLYSSARSEPTARADSEDDYSRALESPAVFSSSPGTGALRVVVPVGVTNAIASSVAPRGAGNDGQPATSLRSVEVTARTPVSGYVLAAGSVVSAVLVSALNSDLPGTVVAQVAQDVYDSPTEGRVLIPKGAKLVGRFATSIMHGQDRIPLVWLRINLPDGRVIDLPGQPATDGQGAAGVPATVDNHLFRTFGAAGTAAAIAAGVQLSQPQTGGTVFSTPSVGQIAGGALGQELGTVSLEIIRRDLNAPPTLRVAPGAMFNLLLTTDLSFARPYVASAS
jgi:type IV secretory pathway VirB10-like protein